MIRIAVKIKIIKVMIKRAKTKEKMEDSDGRRYHA